MTDNRAKGRSRPKPFIFTLPPATICLIYDDAHVSDQGCHISNWPEGSAWPSLTMLRDTIAWWSEIIARARKSTFFTRHIYYKYGRVKWWCTQPTPGVLYSMWREAACLIQWSHNLTTVNPLWIINTKRGCCTRISSLWIDSEFGWLSILTLCGELCGTYNAHLLRHNDAHHPPEQKEADRSFATLCHLSHGP